MKIFATLTNGLTLLVVSAFIVSCSPMGTGHGSGSASSNNSQDENSKVTTGIIGFTENHYDKDLTLRLVQELNDCAFVSAKELTPVTKSLKEELAMRSTHSVANGMSKVLVVDFNKVPHKAFEFSPVRPMDTMHMPKEAKAKPFLVNGLTVYTLENRSQGMGNGFSMTSYSNNLIESKKKVEKLNAETVQSFAENTCSNSNWRSASDMAIEGSKPRVIVLPKIVFKGAKNPEDARMGQSNLNMLLTSSISRSLSNFPMMFDVPTADYKVMELEITPKVQGESAEFAVDLKDYRTGDSLGKRTVIAIKGERNGMGPYYLTLKERSEFEKWLSSFN